MKFFKGKIDIGDTAKNVLGKLDDSFLTSQEKADSTEFVRETLEENTERSKTRRSIAKMIIYNYFVVFWIVIITFFLNAFKIIEVNLNALIDIVVKLQIPFAFITVIAFFFGGYYLRKYKKDKK